MHGSNSVDASRKALGAIYGMVQQQAALLSFVEAFWIMGVIFLCMLPLLLCCVTLAICIRTRTNRAAQR